MSAAKNTPGPWRHICQADWPFTQAVYITAENWGVVATVNIDQSMTHIVDQQRANLRLLTTAPELLDALCDTLDALECWTGSDVRIAKARAAIAKATGVQP